MSENSTKESQNAHNLGMLRSNDPIAVVVLGMHRSGTSMLSRILGLLGGQLPANPASPASDNVTGFWEPKKIVSLHEQLFDLVGFRNDTPMLDRIGGRNIVDYINASDSADQWVQLLTDCVRDEFGIDHKKAIVLKDPRMCRLMPLWDLVFEELKVRPVVVLPIRHPAEIAASLRTRNGFDAGRSMWLWLDHVLRAEHDTRGTPRAFVKYADILDDWRKTIGTVGDRLGLDLATDQCGDQIDRFVSAEYRHFRVEDGLKAPMPKLVSDTFDLLCKTAAQDDDSFESEFDLLGNRFEELRLLSGNWIHQAEGQARLSASNAQSSETQLIQVKNEAQNERVLAREQSSAQDTLAAELRITIESAHTQIALLQAQTQLQAKRTGRVEGLLRRDRTYIDSLKLQLREADEAYTELEEQSRTADSEHTQNLIAQSKLLGDAIARLEDTRSQLTDSEEQLGALRKRRQCLEQEQTRLLAYIDSVHASGSWRITRPLRGTSSTIKSGARMIRNTFSQTIERFGKFVKHHLPMSSDTEWALERAFYRVTAPLLRGTIGYSNFQQRLKFQRTMAPSVTVESASEILNTDQERFELDHVPEAIVVFGIIDWFFRYQRPQHLAEQLARRGHRVFYISPQFVNSSTDGFAEDCITIDENALPEDPFTGVHQVRFHVAGLPPIYNCDLTEAQRDQIIAGLRMMLLRFKIGRTVSMVQHPAWQEFAGCIPNSRMIYDCMDHHEGFSDASGAISDLEHTLLGRADLTIVTSNWLREYALPRAQQVSVIQNACDYDHFAANPSELGIKAKAGSPTVIGYFGAVAEWFDVELIRKVALRFPDSTVLIVGADSCGASDRLSDVPNIHMKGEVPYCDLPPLVHSMDVCMIPFVLSDLILATNPVKVYEMLAAGKPVVTTDLPELRIQEFEGLVYRAKSHEQFIEYVGQALESRDDQALCRKRQEYAAQNRWWDRSKALEAELVSLREPEGSGPLVSIIVVTWNNLHLTKDAISSILADDSYPNIELIIVDNASPDGTVEYLEKLSHAEDRVTVILNSENTGFARANNSGLKAAKGEYLILLNNDTIVTNGWVRTFVNHFKQNPDIGLLGPITNNIGNEARVQTSYQKNEDMPREAFLITRASAGELFDIPVVAFFCCILPRAVYEEVGLLDENFGRGYFEDDDYCQRVRKCGYRICCTSDVFIHHHLSAGFKLLDSGQKNALFHENLKYYESKWGAWSPHRYRDESKPDAIKSNPARTVSDHQSS